MQTVSNTRKIILTFLFIILIIIWGRNVFKIFQINTKDYSQHNFDRQTVMLPDTLTITHYDIVPTKHNPFLNKNKQQQNRQKKKKLKKKEIHLNKEHDRKPTITYSGIIRDNSYSLGIIVTENGNIKLVKKGDIFNSIKVEKVTLDTLIITYNNQIFYYEINK